MDKRIALVSDQRWRFVASPASGDQRNIRKQRYAASGISGEPHMAAGQREELPSRLEHADWHQSRALNHNSVFAEHRLLDHGDDTGIITRGETAVWTSCRSRPLPFFASGYDVRRWLDASNT
jgi:hypothetical protein